jgi:hypothetical protein
MPSDARLRGRQPARRAVQLVGMDEVRLTKGMIESEREGMGLMAAEERDSAQNTDPQATWVDPSMRLPRGS